MKKKDKKKTKMHSPPETSKKVDTKVKCYEDVNHAAYGTLCIEDYSLKSLSSRSSNNNVGSVLCFANWDDQRCSSCVYTENLCNDHRRGGYELSCGNIFPHISTMTVCGKQISYNTISISSSHGSGAHVLVFILFAAVALRALAAVYCKSDHGAMTTAVAVGAHYHHLHLKDDDDEEEEKETTELTVARLSGVGSNRPGVTNSAVVV